MQSKRLDNRSRPINQEGRISQGNLQLVDATENLNWAETPHQKMLGKKEKQLTHIIVAMAVRLYKEWLGTSNNTCLIPCLVINPVSVVTRSV